MTSREGPRARILRSPRSIGPASTTPRPQHCGVGSDNRTKAHPGESSRDRSPRLRLPRCASLTRLVHVSTAYVSGDRCRPDREDELDCGPGFPQSLRAQVHQRRPAGRWPNGGALPAHDRPSPTSSWVIRETDGPFTSLSHSPGGTPRRIRTSERLPGWGSTRLDLVPIDRTSDRRRRSCLPSPCEPRRPEPAPFRA